MGEVVMGKVRLLIFAAILAVPLAASLFGQVPSDVPLEVRLWQRGRSATVVDAPVVPRTETQKARTISAELLKHPLPTKARQILQKALSAAEAGDHAGAIQRLEEALSKYPDSAAWTQPLLGVEYLKTDQFAAAVASLEHAVQLLPHDAVNRSNLGVSLASTGQYDRAETELRRALELDSGNIKAKELLDVLHTIAPANRLAPNHE